MRVRQQRKNTGFTFLEMILVVIVLVVVAGMALPRFSGSFSMMELYDSAEDLQYLMKFAQSRSIARQSMMRLQFDETRESFRLLEKKSDDSLEGRQNTEHEEFVRIPSRIGRPHKVPSGIGIESPKDHINFHPDGNIDRIRINVCGKKKCLIVSTMEQRGYVHLVETEALP